MNEAMHRRWMYISVVAVSLALTFLVLPVQAGETHSASCESTASSALDALKSVANFARSLSSQCATRQSGLAQVENMNEPYPLLGHTISDLLTYAPWRDTAGMNAQSQGFALQINGGIQLLANHVNVIKSLIGLIENSGQSSEQSLQEQQMVLQLGDYASVVAKADFIRGLMPYLIQNFLSSDFPLPTDQGEITLTFNLKNGNGFAGIDIGTILKGTTLPHSGSSLLDLLDVDQVTVKIRNGPLQSEASVDTQDQSGKLNLQWDFGSNSISSTTVFSKGHGLEKQVLSLTAQLGNVNLLGQATFAGNSEELQLRASLADLLTISTLLTPAGFQKPTFGIDISIPFIKKSK
ncbi:hypothetical protein HY229_00540 [Candidatus Acetothermia bacterium]|nr:hypothetical protein [Candidatus Acetothermia bacterium]MBI3642580.1 hypothetical protein [Candidatus Acetothermia bacterium]